METCLLNHFIFNEELRSACDFNPDMLNAGPGIYEVFRVLQGKPLFLEEHIQRFYESANLEQFRLQLSKKDLVHRLKTLIEVNNLKNGNVRFQYLIHSGSGPVFLAWINTNIYPAKADFELGVEVESLHASRKKPHSKRTNLPMWSLAAEIIEKQNIAEVLLVNENQLVTEGHRSNIFFIRENTLVTPSAELVLIGITRDKIIQLARNSNIEVVEKNINIDALKGFEASFLSSTSKNVLPVRRIDDVYYKADNAVTARLASLFDDLVKQHLENFSWDLS